MQPNASCPECRQPPRAPVFPGACEDVRLAAGTRGRAVWGCLPPARDGTAPRSEGTMLGPSTAQNASARTSMRFKAQLYFVLFLARSTQNLRLSEQPQQRLQKLQALWYFYTHH